MTTGIADVLPAIPPSPRIHMEFDGGHIHVTLESNSVDASDADLRELADEIARRMVQVRARQCRHQGASR